MQTSRSIDPELAALATLVPHVDLSDPAAARRIERAVTGEILTPSRARDYELVTIDRADGGQLELAVHESAQAPGTRPSPVLLFLHGGSFITGGLHSEIERCAFYADSARCVVVSVDYRLAPEDPFPAALEDCFAALEWIGRSAADHNLDPERIAIGGLSAGGALAASMALRLSSSSVEHCEWAPEIGPYTRTLKPVLQLLLFPVLDSRLMTRSSQLLEQTPILRSSMLPVLWRHYLGEAGRQNIWAAPSLASDLSGSVPAFVATAQFDPLRDEGVEYAQRLMAADVPVDLRHYARGYHSFDSFHTTRLGRAARHHQVEALTAAFR